MFAAKIEELSFDNSKGKHHEISNHRLDMLLATASVAGTIITDGDTIDVDGANTSSPSRRWRVTPALGRSPVGISRASQLCGCPQSGRKCRAR